MKPTVTSKILTIFISILILLFQNCGGSKSQNNSVTSASSLSFSLENTYLFEGESREIEIEFDSYTSTDESISWKITDDEGVQPTGEFEVTSGSIPVESYSYSAYITIKSTSDSKKENDESYTLYFYKANGELISYSTITLYDDDRGSYRLAITDGELEDLNKGSSYTIEGEIQDLLGSVTNFYNSTTVYWSIQLTNQNLNSSYYFETTSGSFSIEYGDSDFSFPLKIKNNGLTESSLGFTVLLRPIGTDLVSYKSSGNIAASSGSTSEVTTRLSGGAFHTCAIKSGKLSCWGRNQYGQLGVGSTSDLKSPSSVSGLTSGVTHVSAGVDHTCAIRNEALYCWGRNQYGQLGNGSTSTVTSPYLVTGFEEDVSQVEVGDGSTCAIKSSRLYCWGRNDYGQLGLGDTSNRSVGNVVSTLGETVTQISMAYYHMCALSNGSVYCWGLNNYGQLGIGSTTNKSKPQKLSLTSVRQVAVGRESSCSQGSSGLYCWGRNHVGQVGTGSTSSYLNTPYQVSTNNSITSVKGMGYSFCVTTEEALMYCWGSNNYGQLGVGNKTDVTFPNLVASFNKDVNDFTVGYFHSCAFRSDDSLYCWGRNDYGQLGTGTFLEYTAPFIITF